LSILSGIIHYVFVFNGISSFYSVAIESSSVHFISNNLRALKKAILFVGFIVSDKIIYVSFSNIAENNLIIEHRRKENTEYRHKGVCLVIGGLVCLQKT